MATIITSVFGQQVICSLLPAISFHFAKVRFNTASSSEIQEAPVENEIHITFTFHWQTVVRGRSFELGVPLGRARGV